MASEVVVCPNKRKAVTGEECERAAAGSEPPAKKLTRLPRKEVERILALSCEPAYPPIVELKRRNPSLVPSPEEEKDEDMLVLYEAARAFDEADKEYMVFQAQVRHQYKSKGFVEVDFDYFGQIAEAQAFSDQARKEAFKDTDLSSDTEDEDDPFLAFLRNLR